MDTPFGRREFAESLHEGVHTRHLVPALPFAKFIERPGFQAERRREECGGLPCTWQGAAEGRVGLDLPRASQEFGQCMDLLQAKF